MDGDELFKAEQAIFHFHNTELFQRLQHRLGSNWEFSARALHPTASGQRLLQGKWALILDAIYHGDLRFSRIASAANRPAETPDSDNRAILRSKIRIALGAIVAHEKAEATRHARNLRRETTFNRSMIYTGAFLNGLWNAGTDLAQWLKEVNDVLSPTQRALRGIRASFRAQQKARGIDAGFFDAYRNELVKGEKRELVQALGFDPGKVTREQFQRAMEMADLIWEDITLQADLRRFVKDYIAAQHIIEITEFSGTAAFEVLFTILLAVVTAGAGATVFAVNLLGKISAFKHVGKLLIDFFENSKKINQKAGTFSQSSKTADFSDFSSLDSVDVFATKDSVFNPTISQPKDRFSEDTNPVETSNNLEPIFNKIPTSEYLAIKSRSVHNPDSNTLILGKYRPTVTDGIEDWGTPGPDSYVAIARTEHATYFDLGSEWGSITSKYGLTDDEMFTAFNIPVLDDAVSSGKQIKFTHDPRVQGGFLQQEWEYLQEMHGYKRLKEIDGVWYAK